MSRTHEDSLKAAWTALATCALAIKPAYVPVTCLEQDAKAIADDLDLIEAKLKGLVEAYGQAIASNFAHYDPEMTRECIDLMTDGFSQMRVSLLAAGERAEEEWREETMERV